MGLHVVHHLTAVAAVPVGLAPHLERARPWPAAAVADLGRARRGARELTGRHERGRQARRGRHPRASSDPAAAQPGGLGVRAVRDRPGAGADRRRVALARRAGTLSRFVPASAGHERAAVARTPAGQDGRLAGPRPGGRRRGRRDRVRRGARRRLARVRGRRRPGHRARQHRDPSGPGRAVPGPHRRSGASAGRCRTSCCWWRPSPERRVRARWGGRRAPDRLGCAALAAGASRSPSRSSAPRRGPRSRRGPAVRGDPGRRPGPGDGDGPRERDRGRPAERLERAGRVRGAGRGRRRWRAATRSTRCSPCSCPRGGARGGRPGAAWRSTPACWPAR